MNNIFMIVGLGNPDKVYENTHHNMGFMAINEYAKLKNAQFFNKPKFNADVAEINVNENKVLLIKPLTYMNNSGIAVSKIKNFYKIPEKNILVIYDDIDLNVGELRLRQKGSAGSHNGMKSIVENIGTTNFARLRVGIGRDSRFADLADYVLSKVTGEKLILLNEKFKDACQIINEFVLKNGNVCEVLNWMNKNNAKATNK